MIDELEKLARAAITDPWYKPNDLENATNYIEDCNFIAAANPAAILELISINRELVAAADKLMAGLHKRIRDAKDETPVFAGIAGMHNALNRAKGESNE